MSRVRTMRLRRKGVQVRSCAIALAGRGGIFFKHYALWLAYFHVHVLIFVVPHFVKGGSGGGLCQSRKGKKRSVSQDRCVPIELTPSKGLNDRRQEGRNGRQRAIHAEVDYTASVDLSRKNMHIVSFATLIFIYLSRTRPPVFECRRNMS